MSHLDDLSGRFPDVPQTVLLKAELLRCGVRLGEIAAVSQRREPAVDPRTRLQGSIQLAGGVYAYLSHNPKSPYVLQIAEGGRRLTLNVQANKRLEAIAEAKPGPRFRWTSARTSRGTPMSSLFVPAVGGACGPVAVLPLRHCEFVQHDEGCRFCAWMKGSPTTAPPPDVEDVREAITAISEEQRTLGHLVFAGGSALDRSKEADAFVACMKAVKQTGAKLPPTLAAIQALDRVDSMRLYNAGFDYASYAMEVWDRRVWPEVIPGKSRAVGRERWMVCLRDAVDVFGTGRVLCNFVAGVETVAQNGFRTIEEAVDSTLQGMRWCYEHGVYPKYTAWMALPESRWGGRGPAPLEYYVRLMVGRQQLYREYDMRVPATDCQRCLTQSFEADLARLDPARYAPGPAGVYQWHKAHPLASSLGQVAA